MKRTSGFILGIAFVGFLSSAFRLGVLRGHELAVEDLEAELELRDEVIERERADAYLQGYNEALFDARVTGPGVDR